jgi:hypothetical protein
MQLITVPVKAATPSKYRGEISVRWEGCDTLDVTVAATILLHYLAMYCRSLNEILNKFRLYLKCCGV